MLLSMMTKANKMTPQSCINLVRNIINDTDSAIFRQSDAELLIYFNDGLKECSKESPQHFHTTGDFTCTPNQTEQALTYADAQKFISVIRIKDGKAILSMDFEAMQHFNPNWAGDGSGAAQNWTKMQNEKLRFYIYPKAPSIQVLEVIYIRNPLVYALTDTVTDVPNTWESALADYVIYRSESKDDEFVLSNRAVAHYNTFLQKITGSK